jgi:hypothetical protein
MGSTVAARTNNLAEIIGGYFWAMLFLVIGLWPRRKKPEPDSDETAPTSRSTPGP